MICKASIKWISSSGQEHWTRCRGTSKALALASLRARFALMAAQKIATSGTYTWQVDRTTYDCGFASDQPAQDLMLNLVRTVGGATEIAQIIILEASTSYKLAGFFDGRADITNAQLIAVATNYYDDAGNKGYSLLSANYFDSGQQSLKGAKGDTGTGLTGATGPQGIPGIVPSYTWANRPAQTLNNMFFCSDRANLLYFWNGYFWVTEQLYTISPRWRYAQPTTTAVNYSNSSSAYPGRYNGIWLESIDVIIHQAGNITSANYISFQIIGVTGTTRTTLFTSNNQGKTSFRFEVFPSSVYGISPLQLNFSTLEFTITHFGTTGNAYYDYTIYTRGIG
jgi:hypothetical protein